MRRIIPATLLLAAALSAAPALSAQSVHWEPAGGSLPVGEVAQLQLVFEDCSPDDTPAPPKVDGLVVDYNGQSTNISIMNGTFSRNVTVTYAALLQKQDAVDIPSFSVNTSKGKLAVPAAHFAPAGATVGSSGVSLGDAASARLTPSSESVWAGEVFDLKYSIDVADGYGPSWGRGVFEWDPSPLVIEDWTQPEPFHSNDNGARTGLGYQTRAMAPSPGRIRLKPTSQLVNLSVGVTGFGFFQQRQSQQFAVPDGPVSIDVRPLPPSPAGFTGAVGDFKISSKVIPLRVNAGEPITWTVDLSGSGNWPAIRGLPSREAPQEFHVILPKPKRTQAPGKLFEGSLSEDVVLIPTTPGTYTLPDLDFTYFEPKSGAYATITAPGATVTVDPAPQGGAGPNAAAVSAAPGAPSLSLGTPALEAKAPEPPAPGLGDPLQPGESAPLPLRLRTLALMCAIPFALLGLLWLALALRRAKATDPLKPQRDARTRMGATLEALRSAPSAGAAPLLLAWQKDSAVLWGIAHAAPPPAALGDPAWEMLWSEADRSLYSTDSLLPADWVGRAQSALTAKPQKPFSPGRLFLPRNLFPFFVLLLAAAGARPAAAGPIEAYRGGDFAAAGAVWSGKVAADPLDWSSRHNLSLALSQQDRWGEAAAQASAAFVQRPSSPATRRQMALACDKAGFVPEPLDVLLQPGPVQSLARLDSPGGWQRTGAVAAALAAASLALLIARAYGAPRQGWVLPVALAVLAASLLVGAASAVAYRAFGITADTRAVVVWRAGTLRSVPTEADVSQKTTPLPAGSTAIADKVFLEWIRLSFPDGQTGWVPRGEAVFLWQSPGG